MKHYYELPIRFHTLIRRNRDLPTCDLKKSIAQNIYLIITSKFRENRFDETYGCELWDMDFELIANENLWLDRIRKSILLAIGHHERRLYDTGVELTIAQDEGLSSLKGSRSIKKRLTILVRSTITHTGEAFSFNTSIYLSPLSLD